jgi:hypothetical protein
MVRFFSRRMLFVYGISVFLSMAAEAHNGAVAIALPMAEITLDGDFSDWSENLPRYAIEIPEYGIVSENGDDLEASFQVGYNLEKKHLYVAITVRDQSLSFTPAYAGSGICRFRHMEFR